METTPVSTDNQTQSTQEIPPKNIPCCSPQSKFICILTASVLVLLVGAGSFLLGKYSAKPKFPPIPQITPTPLPSETLVKEGTPTVYTEQSRSANWKTYTNNEYGFSFKHPNLIELNNTSYPGGTPEKLIVDMHRDVQKIPGTQDYYKDSLLIDAFENKEKLPLESYANLRQKNNYVVEQESAVVIDGQNGIKQTVQYGSLIYFIKIPNSNQILTIIRGDSKMGSFDTDFDLILSTFRFD